jgi:cobalt/nickel transport protein
VAREGCTFDADGTITGGTCMAQGETANQTEDSPLAGYGLRGIGNDVLSTGLSGAIGVVATFAIGGGVFWLLRAGRKKQAA